MMKRLTALCLLLVLLCSCALAEPLWSPVISEVMPVVRIRTADGSSSFATDYDRNAKLAGLIDYVDAVISITDCDASESLTDVPAEVKARGNWTLDYPKKPIRIKFSKKQSLLGLNEGQAFKSWVLLAEWKDLAMLNNATAFFLAHNILGADGYYCTDYRYVHLYVNDEYWGVYLLAEQQEVKAGRVGIAEPEDNERETGYFFEYDSYFTEERANPDGDPVFEIRHYGSTAPQYGYTIKSDINHSTQRQYVRSCLRLIYRICHEAVANHEFYAFNEKYTALVPAQTATVQETVAQVIDLRSLVDTYILNEIIYDPDLNWSSFFLTLDMSEAGNKLLTFQAPWDFDSSFGIRHGFEDPRQLFCAESGNPWLSLFAGEDWFRDMVSARWDELCAAGLPGDTLALIDTIQAAYTPDFYQNYGAWPMRVLDGNHELTEEMNGFRTQPQAAARLRRWLEERFAYLDEVW